LVDLGRHVPAELRGAGAKHPAVVMHPRPVTVVLVVAVELLELREKRLPLLEAIRDVWNHDGEPTIGPRRCVGTL